MPGFDGTGPRGQGALTGGRRGFCVSRETPAAVFMRRGRGYGCGRGRGYGCGCAWRHGQRDASASLNERSMS